MRKMPILLIIIGTVLINIGFILLACNTTPPKTNTQHPEPTKTIPKKEFTDPRFNKEEEYRIAKKFYKWLNKEYWEIVLENSYRNKLDYPLVLSLIESESTGKPWAKGPWVEIKTKKGTKLSRAIGLMQIMPDYWYKGPVKDLERPTLNIKLGTKIFGQAMKKRKNNLRLALRDYNSGPGSSYFNKPYILETSKRYHKHLKAIAASNVAWSFDDYKSKYGTF